jgi:hypothetical protein
MSLSKLEQDALDHADKAAWRERAGWASSEEAELTLTGEDGAHFEVDEEE